MCVVGAAVVGPVGVLQVPHESLAARPHVSHVEAARYVTPGALAKLQRDHKLWERCRRVSKNKGLMAVRA